MKHLRALLYKLIFVSVLTLGVLIPLDGATVGEALTVALVNTALLYGLGDLVLLPALGNTMSTLADAGVVLLATWLAPFYTGLADVAFSTALTLAVLVGVVEFFFHRYVRDAVLPGPPAGGGQS